MVSERVRAISDVVYPFHGDDSDFDPLLELIGESEIVLLGEATHGTHEFYATRAAITKRLIEERDFVAVLVEGDWPDAYRVHRFLNEEGTDRSLHEAMEGFSHFPSWMWRNQETFDFLEWVYDLNSIRRSESKIGFFGLDIYSLYSSVTEVIDYLEKVDKDAAWEARKRYQCLTLYGRDPQAYGYSVMAGISRPCEQEAIEQLVELRKRQCESVSPKLSSVDDCFSAQHNAQIISNAEGYYRALFSRPQETWNLRDTHMMQSLEAVRQHLSETRRRPAKVVVWAHNSHVGDARATPKGGKGDLTLGQLVRERYGKASALVGFTTYQGSVSAAPFWGGPAEVRPLRPAFRDSYEALFHRVGLPSFMLSMRETTLARDYLSEPRDQRAVGVVYRPDTERLSHYYPTILAEQFDAVIHIDDTQAVQPIEPVVAEAKGEAETYPFGV